MSIDSGAKLFYSQPNIKALRYRKISVGLPLFVAVMAYAYKSTLWVPSQSFEILIADLTTVAAFAIFGLSFLVWYLQTGFQDLTLPRKLTKLLTRTNESNTPNTHRNVVDELSIEVADLKRKHRESITPLSNELINAVLNEAEPALILKLQEKIEDEGEKIKITDDIQRSRLRAIGRIEDELTRLSRSGAITLGFGVFIAIIGIIALAIFVFPKAISLSIFTDSIDPSKATASAVVAHYAPRFSLVVSIEILAYFFLRLHKSKLSETKYYQNELINLELKYISLSAAAHLQRQETLHKVISTFSETERNHVLEKGQSTTELKKMEGGRKN